MTCILAECRNGMTGYQTTPPLQYRGQFDVCSPWRSETGRRDAPEPYRRSIPGQKTALILMLPMCLMGMYRTDMRHNTAKIAVNVGVREQIESGVGAWRLVMRSTKTTSNKQQSGNPTPANP